MQITYVRFYIKPAGFGSPGDFRVAKIIWGEDIFSDLILNSFHRILGLSSPIRNRNPRKTG
jgi:hypothetical protein